MEFTISQIRTYIQSQDSMGDILHNLSETNIIKAINEKKLDYLEDDLGLEIADYEILDGVSFIDGNEFSIGFDGFEIGDSLKDIEDAADIVSCCGDVVDRDIMICPTCKEHI